MLTVDESNLNHHMNITKGKLTRKDKEPQTSQDVGSSDSKPRNNPNASSLKQLGANGLNNNLDLQFGLSLGGGVALKPKFKKIKNMASGNISVLYNGESKKSHHYSRGKDVDLELEELKLKVAMRKEIDYEHLNLPEAKKGKEFRRSFNEIKREKLIRDIKENHLALYNTLKQNIKVLNNWISYVVKLC